MSKDFAGALAQPIVIGCLTSTLALFLRAQRFSQPLGFSAAVDATVSPVGLVRILSDVYEPVCLAIVGLGRHHQDNNGKHDG